MIVRQSISRNVRQLVPKKIKQLIKHSRLYIKHKSNSVNIYHCCVWKSGSQWIAGILSDPRIYQYSGLKVDNWEGRLPPEELDPNTMEDTKFLTGPFSTGTIVSPLYICYESYLNIPKPQNFRTFFVMRDPRDLVVSWYFSVMYSHSLNARVRPVRKTLDDLSLDDGLLFSIKHLADVGLFAAQSSWCNLGRLDENVFLVRFEDIIGPDQFHVFRKIFSHCDISIPDHLLRELLLKYSFKKLSGRNQGEENKLAHYRKGISGDWKHYFNDHIIAEFKKETGDLMEILGYESDTNW